MGDAKRMMKLLACVALIGLSVAMVPPRERDDEAMCQHCAEIWGENGGCVDWYHNQDGHDPAPFFNKRCAEWNKNLDDETSDRCGAWATGECRKRLEHEVGHGGDGGDGMMDGDMDQGDRPRTEDFCAGITEHVDGCLIFDVSLGYNLGTNCAEDQAWTGPMWTGYQTLQKPVEVCTTNVIGNTVVFRCGGDGVIMEDVYHDVTDGSTCDPALGQCDCTGDIMYTMPINNGCTDQFWGGGMLMTWDGWCM